jgi:hypothetical protein
MAWQPKTIRRFIRGFPSSARTALVETDIGPAYIKAMGGPEGPHTLASEWVATQLAAWFGLSTFDFAIIDVAETNEIWFVDKRGSRIGKAESGPAFITRAEAGDSWSGDERQLKMLANPGDIPRLVVFDTWVLNCDRFSHPLGDFASRPRVNRNNVYLSEEAPDGKLRLKAMDHTHCFTCGREWTKSLNQIDIIKDQRLFGLFPEFRTLIGDDRISIQKSAERLRKIDRNLVRGIAQTIPLKWDVSEPVLGALIDFVVDRASFVADTIESKIWRQLGLDFPEGTKEQLS